MDDYALQQELETLAGNAFINPDVRHPEPSNNDAATVPKPKVEPMSATIARWTDLFCLSSDTAVEQIQLHRNNLIRPRVSDELWQTVREEMEALGFDREAYEYSLDAQRKKALLPASAESIAEVYVLGGGVGDDHLTYLVEMNGPLDSIEKLRMAAGMDERPQVVEGKSVEDGRKVHLCCVDAAARNEILRWVAKEIGGGFEPVILVDPRSMR